MPEEYDEIGIWSEVKLAIIKEYCAPYATILDSIRRKSAPSLKWTYIDAYAGPGYHLSKTTGETVEGSPLIALSVKPAFSEYTSLIPIRIALSSLEIWLVRGMTFSPTIKTAMMSF